MSGSTTLISVPTSTNLLTNKANLKTIKINNNNDNFKKPPIPSSTLGNKAKESSDANEASNSFRSSLAPATNDLAKCQFESRLKEIYAKLIQVDDHHNREILYDYFYSDNVSLDASNRVDCPPAQPVTNNTNNKLGTNNNNNNQAIKSQAQSNHLSSNSSSYSRVLEFSEWNEGICDWTFTNPYPSLRNYANAIVKRKNRVRDPIEFDEDIGMFVPAGNKLRPPPPPAAPPQPSIHLDLSSQSSTPSQIITLNSILTNYDHHPTNSFNNANTSTVVTTTYTNTNSTNNFLVNNAANNPSIKLLNSIAKNLTNNSFNSSLSLLISANNNKNNNNLNLEPVAQTHLHHHPPIHQPSHNPNLNTLNNPIASERLRRELQKLVDAHAQKAQSHSDDEEEAAQVPAKMLLSNSSNHSLANAASNRRPSSGSNFSKKTSQTVTFQATESNNTGDSKNVNDSSSTRQPILMITSNSLTSNNNNNNNYNNNNYNNNNNNAAINYRLGISFTGGGVYQRNQSLEQMGSGNLKSVKGVGFNKSDSESNILLTTQFSYGNQMSGLGGGLSAKKILPVIVSPNNNSASSSSNINTSAIISPNTNSSNEEQQSTSSSKQPTSGAYNPANNVFYTKALGQNMSLGRSNNKNSNQQLLSVTDNSNNNNSSSNNIKAIGSNSYKQIVYLDDDGLVSGPPPDNLSNDSFFYINSINSCSRHNSYPTNAISNTNGRSQAQVSKGFKPNANASLVKQLANYSSSAHLLNGVYSSIRPDTYEASSSNINYIMNGGNHVLAAHNINTADLVPPSTAGAANALPPIVAGKRINMPLGPHRYAQYHRPNKARLYKSSSASLDALKNE